jgi:hypothetical protein
MNYERKILNATVQDAETALFEQYGKNSTFEKARNPDGVLYVIRVNPKALAKCKVSKIDGGVSIEMGPHTGGVTIAIVLVAYLFFVVPGIFLTIWFVFTRSLTSKSIHSRFDSIVAATEFLAKKRLSEAGQPI